MVTTKMFGDFSPYYFFNNDEIITGNTFADLNKLNKYNWELDISTVLSLINFNYIPGDRTLIKDVFRVPWHSQITKNKILRNPPIPHANNIYSQEYIADKFIELLEIEFITEFSNYKNLWILQTGGLDSRITIAIINKLKKENKLKSKINLVTWGDKNSRDVLYSKQIALHFDYEFYHIDITPNILKENIEIAVDFGNAEVSAFHYHGMSKLKELVSIEDCVIASSYGDSIGRAEYSGSHLTDINLQTINNPYNLFNTNIYNKHKTIIENDRSSAWITDREQSKNIKNELDMQENYMRRMIAHAMDYIKSFTTLKQTFTSDQIVSFVFSISPICRNFDTYYQIFTKLDPYFLRIPWARTGISLENDYIDNDPKHLKDYHSYKKWFLDDYYNVISSTILNGKLIANNIICLSSIENLLNHWKHNIEIGELISKLYQIELLIEKYKLDVVYHESLPISPNKGLLSKSILVYKIGHKIEKIGHKIKMYGQ